MPSQLEDHFEGLRQAAQTLREKGFDGLDEYNLARYDKDGRKIYSFEHRDKTTAYIGPDLDEKPELFPAVEKEAEELLFKYADPDVRQFFENKPVADAVDASDGFSLDVGPGGSRVRYSQLHLAAAGVSEQLGKRNRALQDILTEEAKQLDRELVEKGFKPNVYRSGQHSALEIKDPSTATMSAARYADVDAKLPDGTSVEGMHVAELQSDYADDLRKLGPNNRTAAMDDVEALELEGEIVSLDWKIEDSKTPDLPEGNPALLAERESLRNKQERLQRRAQSFKSGSNKNMYQVPELYPEMGERGNAQQIIEIIGATMGAVKRGKNSVSFPIPDDIGSSVAKPLYDSTKFNNNIREAVKRLGKDYKATLIEFTDKNGNVVQRPGITWSGAEPAIGKESIGGVKMFRAGGIISAKPQVRGNSGIVDVIKKYRREGMMD